uniref:NADH dehydrogenase subunit 2 n=1 Tax=Olinga feredayi TaxID=177813 RepID=UPI0028D022B9|nr:NADH dehydrogenase subunit 2 [Olinga feredayi]WMQ76533.1 NADH dehydrogenase subunit 2 [Olinga feredayi]
MLKNYNYMYLMILIMSTLFSISSNSWINIWMGMEINLMSFIPLMMDNYNSLTNESMMKYFLIQAIASTFFFFFIILKMLKMKWFISEMSLIPTIIINLALLMKMGAAPFYQWFPQVMKNLSWKNCFILSTWQKIIPIMTLSYMMNYKILYISIIMSALIGSIMGLNQNNLKFIMTFSSINHLSWIITSILINMNLWNMYFICYSILTFSCMFIFYSFNLSHMNQFFSLKINNMMKIMIIMNFLSLGGLPPMFGFFPKWLVINSLTTNNNLFIVILLVMTSLINLFFYLRLTISSLMILNYELKWNFYLNTSNLTLKFITYLNIFWLIMMIFS